MIFFDKSKIKSDKNVSLKQNNLTTKLFKKLDEWFQICFFLFYH